jgi:hypothetical protein
MMRKINRPLYWITAIIAVAAIAALTMAIRSRIAASAHKRYLSRIVASVNGDVIRQSDIVDFAPNETADQVLGILVDFKLIDQAAKRRNLSVSDSDLQLMRTNATLAANAKSYAAAAQKLGRSPSGLDSQLVHAALLEQLTARQLPPAPSQMVHAYAILIKPHGRHTTSDAQAAALAHRLQAQVDAGAPFAPLADRYSDDDISRAADGDLGVVQDSVPAPLSFENDYPLFQALTGPASMGRLTAPVKGALGYWVVRIASTARNPGNDSGLYAPVQGRFRSMWLNRLEPAEMAQLRGKAVILPPLREGPPQRPYAGSRPAQSPGDRVSTSRSPCNRTGDSV